jgi:hypothetical protein
MKRKTDKNEKNLNASKFQMFFFLHTDYICFKP